MLLLAAANLWLILIIAGGFTPLSDTIAPLTGHLIGMGLTASLALLIRRRVAALLAAGAVATVVVHVGLGLARCCNAPPTPIEPPITQIAARSAEGGLSVLALNTWHGHGDLGRLERYLATAPADVIVLSEFGPTKQPLLARLKSTYPFQVDCAGEWACSLALISRRPFEAAGASRIAAGKPAFVWARLGGSLTVIGTHLYRPSRNPWLHARQMREFVQFIRRIDGPLILAGDLNTSPWSASFRMLRSATGLTPASILMPTWPAWPVALPQVALDHIFFSPDLAATAAGTGPPVGSDHLPVWAQLERRAAVHERGRRPARTLASRLAAASPDLGGEFLADFGGEHGSAGYLRR